MSLSSEQWVTESPAHLQERLFDVIVVGAGPAGSTAAFQCAHKGVAVLLLDKARFPRAKACGDAVMYPALLELAQMELLEPMRRLFQPVTQIQFWQAQHALPPAPILDQHQTQDFPSLSVGGYVAPRDQFDTLLAGSAIAAGATWRDQCVIEHLTVEQDRVLLRGCCLSRPITLQARLLIIADGAGSRLGRQVRHMQIEQGVQTPLLAPELSSTRFTAIRGYVELGNLTETLEFYFGQHPDLFYHWVFPTETQAQIANVGVIAPTKQWKKLSSSLFPQQALTAFLQTPAFYERISRWHWQKLPQAAPVCSGLHGESTLYGTRMLCVGEAASLVDPQPAEGISGALVSGRLAADIGTEALARDRLTLSDLAPYGEAIRTRYLARYTAALQTIQMP